MKAKELEMSTLVKRLSDEDRERQASERKEKSKIQKDYEQLERNYLELEQSKKQDLQTAQ